MKRLKLLSIPVALLLIASIIGGIFWWNTPRVEATQGVLSISVGLNSDTQPPASSAKFDSSNRIKTVKGSNLDESSLSDLSWATSGEKVGLRIDPPVLPSNIKVLGQPLPTQSHAITLDPQTGNMAWYTNNSKTPTVQWYPRVVFNSQTFQITSISKTGRFNPSANGIVLGWDGQVVTPSGNLAYSINQWASTSRDNFGLQVSFTSPINLPAFSYELVFTPSNDIDGVRLSSYVVGNILPDVTYVDYPIKQTASTDLPLDVTKDIKFLASGKVIAEYGFRDLYVRAQSAYWRIDTDLSIVIGFRFSGLTIGQQFNNDGYFGVSVGDYTEETSAGQLLGSKFQNTVGDGTLIQIDEYFDDTTPAGSVELGIYYDNAGTPTTLLLDAGAVGVANGWVSVGSLSLPVALNTNYWLARDSSVACGTRYDLAYGTGCQYYHNQAYGALPSPFGSGSGGNNVAVMRAYVNTAVTSPHTYSATASSGGWANSSYGYMSDNQYTTRNPTVILNQSPTTNSNGAMPWANPSYAYRSNNQYATAVSLIPTYRATGAMAHGTTGSITPALPTGTVANDIVILVASTIAGGSITMGATGSITTWNAMPSSPIDVTGGEKLYVWWGR